jgi:RimJ/RimL family protein N-acetyltransferase
MKILSLGYRTDLLFHHFEGEVLEREDYLVLRTPEQQGYYWGNLLLFPKAPGPGDYRRWRALFQQEFQDLPGVRHETFGWDEVGEACGDLAPFLEAGFESDPGVVLTARETHPPPRELRELEVRVLTRDQDWEDASTCQVACRDPRFEEATYWAFKKKRMECLRAMVEAGLGRWFGAFLEGQLVGDLGIFMDREVGRFQTVGTLPDFRRRGVCGTLVHRSSQIAFAELGAEELVIVADLGDAAERVYGSVGYRPRELQNGVCLYPEEGSRT